MDDETLRALKALIEPARIRILGMLAERPHTTAEISEVFGRRRGGRFLAPTTIARHLGFLRVAGLVREVETPAGSRLALGVERLSELGRALDALEPSSPASAPDAAEVAGARLPPDDAKVLRAFLAGDRLTSIPAVGRKRRVILRWLVDRCFPEDRPYVEKEVNALLALRHPDVAALRRYLVDEGFMTRDHGVYRAAGSPGPAGADTVEAKATADASATAEATASPAAKRPGAVP